jgi:tetratricopeptide (TPR) repeat protein
MNYISSCHRYASEGQLTWLRGRNNMNGTKSTCLLLVTLGLLLLGCGQKQDEATRVEYTQEDGKKTSNIRKVQDGTAKYEIVGSGTVPAKAQELHNQARAKGQAGDYRSAMVLLKQAIEVAPQWAYPYYDLAFTHLLQGDMTNAVVNYQVVDRLEPAGFFTTKTALWTLAREEQGVFPKGTYLSYVSLEWADPAKKRELIERMNTNLPAFAPAWKERAQLTQDSAQALAFYEKALALDPDPETYGLCTINKAVLLFNDRRTAEARHLIVQLLRTNTTTTGTKTLANEVLKRWK